MEHTETAPTTWKDWWPLVITFAVIAALTVSFAVPSDDRLYTASMYGMGFFFVFFALFKLIDLRAFAAGYAEYDLISRRLFSWGYIYPFIELALGILYLNSVDQTWLHSTTIVLSGIICTGVFKKLLRKERVKCLCLGTVLKIPLTTVSLFEYLLMGVMAGALLLR